MNGCHIYYSPPRIGDIGIVAAVWAEIAPDRMIGYRCRMERALVIDGEIMQDGWPADIVQWAYEVIEGVSEGEPGSTGQ